ncbi:MAG TPA: Calx-beta domain-containing protein [Roseiflexaceae bacterium]|nr:Calx-beta domain-containing protein [Roseiflexaceae bacterium]
MQFYAALNRSSAAQAADANQRILLVDDDTNDPDVRGSYTAALDGLGVAYDIWDATAKAAEPDAAALASYATVLWFTGGSGFPDIEGETALIDFLARDRCLLISSQEYLYSRGSMPTQFMQSHLGVATATDDVAAVNVTGVGPVFDGIGPSILQLPYENRTDRISPNASASLAFRGVSAGSVDMGVQKDAGSYRTTFWGFGLEGLPTAQERQDVLQRVLNWCAFQTDLSIQQVASPATLLRPGQPLTYSLRYQNNGVALASGVVLTDTVPAALTNLSVSSSGPALTALPGAPYRWQIADLAPGASGAITITGVIKPGLTADVGGANIATVTTEVFDSDAANNSAQTILDVRVPQLQFSSANYSVAEQDGAALITVTLDAPNPFADVGVAYATSDGTAGASSDYTAQAGRLMILAGQSSASFSVPITDDSLPEGGETVLLMLSNPAGAAIGSPAAATLTIRSSDGIAAPQIISSPPPDAKRGTPYSYQFVASGLPLPSFMISAGTLPPGLLLSTEGLLSGWPTQAGRYQSISVTASNGLAPDATQTFDIVVSADTQVYLPLVVGKR